MHKNFDLYIVAQIRIKTKLFLINRPEPMNSKLFTSLLSKAELQINKKTSKIKYTLILYYTQAESKQKTVYVLCIYMKFCLAIHQISLAVVYSSGKSNIFFFKINK